MVSATAEPAEPVPVEPPQGVSYRGHHRCTALELALDLLELNGTDLDLLLLLSPLMLLPLAVRWPWLCRADRYQLRLEGSPSLAASASHAALTVGRRSEKRRARRQCRVFRSETPGWRLEARRGFINGQIQGGKVGRGLDFSRLFGPSTFKPFLRMGSADYLRQLAPNKIEPNTLQNLNRPSYSSGQCNITVLDPVSTTTRTPLPGASPIRAPVPAASRCAKAWGRHGGW